MQNMWFDPGPLPFLRLDMRIEPQEKHLYFKLVFLKI